MRPIQADRLTRAMLALLILVSARAARAQDSAPTTREGWVLGGLVGRLGVGGQPDARATSIGFAAERFTPWRPNLDMAVATIPRLLRDGQVPLHARLGMALPIGAAKGPYLVPNVGIDAGGAAGDRADGWVGFHWGARALVAARQVGVQAGVVWVRATGASTSLWLAELGLMRLPLPAPRKPRATTPVPGET